MHAILTEDIMVAAHVVTQGYVLVLWIPRFFSNWSLPPKQNNCYMYMYIALHSYMYLIAILLNGWI